MRSEITPACPACARTELVEWRAATPANPRLTSRPSYRLGRCPLCGTAALLDRDQSPGLYEQGTYAPGGRRARAMLERLRALSGWDRRRLVGHLPASSRVLEIGAGRGDLVGSLAARGHEAIGIEPAEGWAALARERGAAVEQVTIEKASFAERSFDRVILWHVLEHLDDPAAAVDRVAPWLAPGGRLVVAVPNLASFQARLGGDRWFHQDVPRHRTHFTVRGATELLRRRGFAPARVRFAALDQSQLGMWLTLLNKLTHSRDVPFRYLKGDLHYSSRAAALRDAVTSVGAGIPLMPIGALLELAAALARRGGNVVVEAARP